MTQKVPIPAYLSEDGRIQAFVIPTWEDPIPIDATVPVLRLPLHKVQQLASRCLPEDEVNALALPVVINQHEGTYKVDYLDTAVLDFFGVSDWSRITQQMLDAARQAQRIDELKRYRMLVLKTVTTHQWVEVASMSDVEAQLSVHEQAADMEFDNSGGSPVTHYTIDHIEEIDAPQPPATRPKP